MRVFHLLLLSAAVAPPPHRPAREGDVVRWEREARAVTIVRDDWGIAACRKVMELHANSSNNTVYADADGRIAYFHRSRAERRARPRRSGWGSGRRG